mgnify:CR=1 FL=1
MEFTDKQMSFLNAATTKYGEGAVLTTENITETAEENGLAFHFMENKAISQLPKETSCQVLSEKKNKKGIIYCFVVLKNNKTEKNYMKGIKFKQYGWVKKEDLK